MEQEPKYVRNITLGLRGFQLLCVSFVITGFLWATTDWLLATVLVQAPVTPISILFMLYGTLGSFMTEGTIRIIKRKIRGKN